MSKTSRELIESYLEKNGLKMRKQISSASSSFFSYHPPTYDKRTVYSFDHLFELSDNGFSVMDDIGVFIFNAIVTQPPKRRKTKGKTK